MRKARLKRRTWTTGNKKDKRKKQEQRRGKAAQLNRKQQMRVKCLKEAFCCLTHLTLMHNSISNAMPTWACMQVASFFFLVNRLFPAYFKVNLPLCHTNSHICFTCRLYLTSFPQKFHTECPPHPPTPFTLRLLLARVSPCSQDGCFLTCLTSHCLYLCLSLRDLNTQAGSHLLLPFHRYASPARWSSVGLQANVYKPCNVCVCALGLVKHVPHMRLLVRPSVFPLCSLS